MASLSAHILSATAVAVWRLPAVGLLLAGLGMLLLHSGIEELAVLPLAADATVRETAGAEANLAPVGPPPSARDGGRRGWGEVWSGTGDLAPVAPGRSLRPATHVAAPQTGTSRARAVAPRAQRPADRIDRRAAALFGPPDRHPQATLVEAFLNRERGAARRYLEGTAASRWLAPWSRALLAWEETSGYGAVERSRASRQVRGLVVPRSLGCVVGAEYQETPSCSAIPAPPGEPHGDHDPARAGTQTASVRDPGSGDGAAAPS